MDFSHHINKNRKAWNAKTEIHVKSKFYDNDSFLQGKNTLKSIELALLGDIKNKTILHLQCHFGQDSISLARLGAKVTGVDFSDKAIETARLFAKQVDADAEFICCEIYDLDRFLKKTYDIVITSYGTIGWLPDLDKWAGSIASHLKPGGRFVFVEFHPVVWMFDDEFRQVTYNYFNREPMEEAELGTYADRDAPIVIETVGWNHSISEVLNSLINNGLEINSLDEFDYSPSDCFKHMISSEPGKFRISHLKNRIPMVYSVLATKKILVENK